MCVSPLKILNNSKYIDCSCSKYYRLVPCGRCYQCRNQQVDDWTVRCYSEYKYSVYTYFYTLTFSPDNLPSYRGLRCFSKELVQLFLKRLRKALSKVDSHLVLRYFISSELGEHTHRPHYHALFFITFDSDDNGTYYVSDFNSRVFKNLIEKTWSYGFIKAGDNLGLVNSAAGIKYVIKYLLKTDTYYNNFAKSLFFRVARKWLCIYKSYGLVVPCHKSMGRGYLINYDSTDYPSPNVSVWNNFVYAARKEFNHFASHHLQSQSLGKYAYELFNVSDNTVSDLGLTSNYHYHTPLSVKRSLFCDKIFSSADFEAGREYATSYRLNGDGIKYYTDVIINNYIPNTCNNILDIISNVKKSSISVMSSLLDLPLHILDKFSKLDKSTIYKLSIYINVYRYLYISPSFKRIQDNIFDLQNIRKVIRTMLAQSNFSCLITRYDFICNCSGITVDFPQFTDFEAFCTVIDFYTNYINACKSAKALSDLKKQRKIKSKILNL